MKKYYLIALIFISVILANATIKIQLVHAEKNTIKIFSSADAEMLGIKIDMKKDDLEKVVGKPEKTESHYEGAFGTVYTYYYKFGSVRLEPLSETEYTVSSIIIDKPNYEGPRKIKVNDEVETVLKKFPQNNKLIVNKNGSSYLYGKEGENCGFVQYDKNGQIISIAYKYGNEGFGEFSLWMDVKDNKVISFSVQVMNV